jgi:tetratricopeptide (TPR) repeat protein
MQLERAFFQTVTVVLVAVMAVAADPLPSLALLPIAEISSTTADQLLQQGNQQYQSGQVEAAIQLWQQARAGYQQLHNQSGEGAALINIGAAAVRLERYKEAAIALEAFLLLAQALPNRHSEAQAFSNLGIAYQALGNYVKAIKSHQQSVKIMLSLGDRQGVGQSLGNLGNALEALGDYENATLSYQQSLKIARQVGDRPGGSIALNNLGVMYTNLGKYKEALPLFQESLKVSQALGDQAGQASTLINLGSVYQSLGNNNKAISYYQQSLKLAQAVKVRRYELEALGNLGLAYGDLRDYPRALQCQEQSLKLAQAIGDRRSEAMALNNMGHILLSTGRLAEAEAKLRTALKLREQLRDALDDNYKISLIDTQLYTYTLLQKVLIAGRQFEAALEVAEQGRARAFVELLAKRLSQEGNGRAETPETLALSPTLQQIKATARRRNATIVEYTLLTDNAFKFRGKIRGPETDLLIWVVQPKAASSSAK